MKRELAKKSKLERCKKRDRQATKTCLQVSASTFEHNTAKV